MKNEHQRENKREKLMKNMNYYFKCSKYVCIRWRDCRRLTCWFRFAHHSSSALATVYSPGQMTQAPRHHISACRHESHKLYYSYWTHYNTRVKIYCRHHIFLFLSCFFFCVCHFYQRRTYHRRWWFGYGCTIGFVVNCE